MDTDYDQNKEFTTLSDAELTVGYWLERPYVSLMLGVVVVLMLVFLALKAGFSLWIMNKLGLGETLVNGRGEPDFWTIKTTLDNYQRPAVNPQQTIKSEVALAPPSGKKEKLTNPKMLAALL